MPEPHRLVIASGCQALPVRAPGDRFDRARMSNQKLDELKVVLDKLNAQRK